MTAQIITHTSPDGTVRIGSSPEAPDFVIEAEDLEDARMRVSAYALQVAKEWDEPVNVDATDPTGTYAFRVYPDGTTQDAIPEVTATAQPEPTAQPESTAQPEPAENKSVPEEPKVKPAPRPMPSATAAPSSPATGHPTPKAAPTESWWSRLRSMFSKDSTPAVEPDPAAEQRAADFRTVARYWDRCMTITVANAKGGVGKTPTAQQLAAAFALAGVGPVLYLEMNLTRGTGSWTTDRSDRHNRTVQDFLDSIEEHEKQEAQLAGFAAYVHHQTTDKYDVLNANPALLSSYQQISPADFVRLHTVLARAYRLIIVDTGNDEGTDLWQSIVNGTDQLVIVSDTRIVSSATATAMIAGLEEWGGRYRSIARNAVVAVNDANGRRSATVLAEELGSLVRSATVIPYDDALHDSDDMIVHHNMLRQETQDAYLHLAALIADGLSDVEQGVR